MREGAGAHVNFIIRFEIEMETALKRGREKEAVAICSGDATPAALSNVNRLQTALLSLIIPSASRMNRSALNLRHCTGGGPGLA